MLVLKDGPCEGVYRTKRVPLFLLTVVRGAGKKDVMDQP